MSHRILAMREMGNGPHERPTCIPARYRAATIADIPDVGLRNVMVDYGNAFWSVAIQGIAPLFLGAVGSWKTTAAAVLATALRVRYGIGVGWLGASSELVKLDREAFRDETRRRVDDLKTTPFLVIDDFTQARPGSRQLDLLVEIGTARFDEALPTLYTGNLELSKGSTKALNDAVGSCLARRILDGSEGYRVVVK